MSSADKQEPDFGAMLRTAGKEQKLFGRYTLKRVLGRGGMGIVWLAHDDELIRYVAMKFLPDMLVRDREAVEDLKRETRRSLDLTHHHIVRIYDFTQDEMCAAIIMEFVDGETLSAMKSQQAGGCFGVSVAAPWVGHFASALDYAHRQALVVHRDLKPANLMINSRGDLKITDFGISRSMSDSMTRVSVSNTAGTLAYMSPEQALGAPPTPGDDIYAFGATVYDMLTGRPPFFRGNLQVQLETVIPPRMEDRRTELGNTGEPIPELWQEVISACLAKRPQERPQSIAEVAAMLGLAGSSSSLRPSTSTGSTSSGTTGTTRTRAHATDDAVTDEQAGGPTPGTARPSTSRPATAGPRPTGLDDILSAPSIRDERPIVADQARVTAKSSQGTGIAQTIPPEDLTLSGQKASEFTKAPIVPAPEESQASVAASPATFPGGPLSTPAEKSSRGLAIAALVSLAVVASGLAWMFLKPASPKTVVSTPVAPVATPAVPVAPPVAPVAKVEPKIEPVVVPPTVPPPTYETQIEEIRKLIAAEKLPEATEAIGKLPPDLASIGELKTAVSAKEAAIQKAASEMKMAKQTQDIAELIAASKTALSKEDYSGARAPLLRVLAEYDSTHVDAKAQMAAIDQAETGMIKKREDDFLKQILQSAEQALKDGDYANAEDMLETAPPDRAGDAAVVVLKKRIDSERIAAMNRPRTTTKTTNNSSGSSSRPKSSSSSQPRPKPKSEPAPAVSRPTVVTKPVVQKPSQQPPAPRKNTPFRGGAPGG